MEYTKENPLRVFESFAGYGSQSMALERLRETYPDFDFRVVGISEIDDFAIQSYMAVHGETINYGDICKIDWNEVPDFDLFTYSFPCFVAGTLINTELGTKPIEEITFIDRVLTHTCTYQQVVRTMRKEYKGDLYTIHGMCCDDIICTPNHPLYARKRYRKGHKGIRTFKPAEWIKAKELTKDYYLGFAINQESKLPKWSGFIDNRWGHHKIVNRLTELFDNPTFWYIMGRYMGDGWKRTNPKYGSGIIICCSDRNEKSLLTALDDIGFHYCIVQERTAKKVHISSNELHHFVDRFGYKAHGKHIDAETLNLPVRLLKGFMDGMMDSDGCSRNGYNHITTVSRELAIGLCHCVAKVYNMPPQIGVFHRPPKVIIEGRECNQRDSWTVRWKDEPKKQDNAFYEAGYIWFPITRITKEYKETTVYNMEVEKDNSYTANNAIVHNCQAISAAGTQKGLAEGSGTTSSLLWECRRAIDVKRPKYLLMENVKALTQKKFMPEFQKWLKELEDFGYTNYWKVLNSKDFGVPQNRERVFCVSILNVEDAAQYHFPKHFPLEKRIKDIVETNVDESFYLKPDRLANLNIELYEQEDGSLIAKPKNE